MKERTLTPQSRPGWFGRLLCILFPFVRQVAADRDRLAAELAARLRPTGEHYRVVTDLMSDYAWATRIHADGSRSPDWMVGRNEAITGYTWDEITRDNAFRLYHPDDRERARQDVAALRPGEPQTGTYRIVTRGGEVRWLTIRRLIETGSDGVRRLYGVASDVTDLKNAQAELEAERNLLQAIIDTVPDVIFVKDRAGHLLRLNRAGYRELGDLPPAAIIGKTDFDFIDAQYAGVFRAVEEQVMATGKLIVSPEECVTTLDGSTVWTASWKAPLHDSDGSIIGIVGSSRVITEQKQNQLALEAERNRLQTLIDTIPDYIYIKDTDLRFQLVNRAVLDFLGLPDMDAIIGKTDHDFWPEEAAAYAAAERQMLASGRPVRALEQHTPRPDHASAVWLETAKTPLYDRDGQLIGLVGIGRDVTAQKQTQAALEAERNRLQALFDTLPDYIYIKDTDLRFVLVNRAVTAGFGLSNATACIGKTSADFFPADFAAVHNAIERRVIETGEPLLNGEFDVPLGDEAAPRKMVISKTPLRDGTGQITGLVGIARDVTEQVAMQQRNLELTVEREKSLVLRNVLRDLSHDLRTPLSAINTGLYLLRRQIETPAGLERLDRIDEQVTHLSAVLDQLFRMSDIDQTEQLALSLADVNTLIDEVMPLFSQMAAAKGLELHPDLAADAPPASIHTLQFSLALTNLVKNAIEYTETGGYVTLRTRVADDHLCVEVADTGIGIAPEQLEHIFDRLYRVDTARSPRMGSAGLGLAIARRIIDLHGGRIEAESEPGRGSLFRILLPLPTDPAGQSS